MKGKKARSGVTSLCLHEQFPTRKQVTEARMESKGLLDDGNWSYVSLAFLSQMDVYAAGFVCVRGFDLKTRAPRPLVARFHFPASKQTRSKRTTARKTDE